MYVFDKSEPIMLSVLPFIPYPKFIPIILIAHKPTSPSASAHDYIVAEYICVNKIDIVRNTS